jgi:hypothetical protein
MEPFINFQDWFFGVRATLCQIGLIDIIENEQYVVLNRSGYQMVGSLLHNVLNTDTAVLTYHQTALSNSDRGFIGYHIFKALMDHFGSATLMIACHAQYVKRTNTLIFDRYLPEEEAIQSADHYLENFKGLYCKIKIYDKALNALPESERETWTSEKCVSDESHRLALLEGIRDLKYESKVSHLEEAKKDLHVIMNEVINLHIAECIKLNQNVVRVVADLEPDYTNVFETRIAFKAKGPSHRSSFSKTPGRAGVTSKGRASFVSKNEHPHPRTARTTGISSGAISKSHARIASQKDRVSSKTLQKSTKGKFEHLASGWDFLTLKEKKAYNLGGPTTLPDDFKLRKAHPHSHLNLHNNEKRAYASASAGGYYGRCDTRPGNQRYVQATAEYSEKRNSNSVNHSRMDKKNKAKRYLTKAKQDQKKRFEPKAKARLVIADPEETEAEDEDGLGAEIELKSVTNQSVEEVISVTGSLYRNMSSAQVESDHVFSLMGMTEVGPGESPDHSTQDDQASIDTML